MAQKFYQDMTAEEQTRWVKEFATIVEEHGEQITQIGKGKEQMTAEDLPWVKGLFDILCAFPFAQDFCEKAMRYGDFSSRVSRLSIYVDKVKDTLADGLVMTDTSGRAVAFVSPSSPLRRRGRPTKEEVAARLRGETLVLPDNSPENEKRRRIAKLLGLEVVINGEAPREKNNAELKAEREEKRRKEEAMNPSLFTDEKHDNKVITESQNKEAPALQQSPTMSMGDIYQDRIENDRMHLSDIAWLCSKELQNRIALVRNQRTAFGDAAQTAKVLAERGGAQEEIAAYAKQAEEAREAYESTYKAVDNELAVLHKRLMIDIPYTGKFKNKFKGVDVEKVLHITRPYYEKIRKEDPTIDERIKTLIEQDSPEYAAKMKADEEKKQEVTELLRYLKRKDKPNVKQRIETMEKRYARLVELLGEEAKVYRPIVDAAIQDYDKNYKKLDVEPTDTANKKLEKVAATGNAAAMEKKPAKQENKKATNQVSKKPAKQQTQKTRKENK